MMQKIDQSFQHRNWERTYNISVDPITGRYFCAYMEQELKYYNTLVTEFNSKLRVLYTEIENIKDQYERIWLGVAQTGANLRLLAKEPVSTWPDVLKPYVEYIIKDDKFLLSDRMMMLFDIAASKAIIHHLVRRAIATEVLRLVQPQAKQIAEADTNTSGQMRTPIQMLQPMDYSFKRHLQLVPGTVEITYDTEKKSTLIKTPYSSKPLIIKDYDLTKMPHDHIILRQRPGRLPNENTPWQITVRDGTGKYLLDIKDMSYVSRKKFSR